MAFSIDNNSTSTWHHASKNMVYDQCVVSIEYNGNVHQSRVNTKWPTVTMWWELLVSEILWTSENSVHVLVLWRCGQLSKTLKIPVPFFCCYMWLGFEWWRVFLLHVGIYSCACADSMFVLPMQKISLHPRMLVFVLEMDPMWDWNLRFTMTILCSRRVRQMQAEFVSFSHLIFVLMM